MKTLWADDLKSEYEKGRKQLQAYKGTLDRNNIHDEQLLTFANSMINGSLKTEEWLTTGRDPNTFGGVDARAVYQRNSMSEMDWIPDIRDELTEGPEELTLTANDKAKLKRIFTALSPRERQCYILHYAQRLSMAQVAVELEISKATVQMYIKRAREKVEMRR